MVDHAVALMPAFIQTLNVCQAGRGKHGQSKEGIGEICSREIGAAEVQPRQSGAYEERVS